VTAVNVAEKTYIDDSEFVAASPLSVKPKVRLKAGFTLKPNARVREPFTEEGESAEEEAAVSGVSTGAESPSRIQKVFRILFFVCVLFFAGELVWLFLITPARPFSSVVITGTESGFMEKDEALSVAGIGAKTSYLSLDTRAAEKNLCGVPAVESAKVEKHFPGTVRITVVPRKSVALFLRNVNGKAVPVYFDKHGVVFKSGGGKTDAFRSVPVVSGIETTAAEGSRLASAYIPLCERLDKLSSVSPNLYQAISEIAVNKKTYDGFDITLFPSHAPVKIRMNAELDEEAVGYVFLLLDVLEAEGVRVSEIDYRTGTASYMVKGASGNG
jgi:cell division protein FtsQ